MFPSGSEILIKTAARVFRSVKSFNKSAETIKALFRLSFAWCETKKINWLIIYFGRNHLLIENMAIGIIAWVAKDSKQIFIKEKANIEIGLDHLLLKCIFFSFEFSWFIKTFELSLRKCIFIKIVNRQSNW